MRTVVDAVVAVRGGPGTLTAPDASGTARRVTWAEVHTRALRMATVLAGDGVGRGRRVGLLADTSLDLVTALQAVWLTGAAVTMLPVPGRVDMEAVARLSGIIADADLHLVLVGEPMRPLLPALAATTKAGLLDELGAAAVTAAPASPGSPDPDDLAVLQYTSGSTRSPRGVPVRHRHLAANLLAIRAAVDHDAHHPYTALSWLPLYHDMGLIGFCALPMSCGCPLVLRSPLTFVRRPASWLETVARDRIAVTGAPNFAHALANRLLSAGMSVDLSSLRLLVSGGEPVDAVMMAELATAGQRCGLDPAALLPAYGLAESTLAVTFSRPGAGVRTDGVDRLVLEAEGRAVPGSRELVRLGTPVLGSHVRITHRTTGEPLEERRVGHIEVAGPSVIGHYWGEPPPASPWLRTGDLGYLAEGELVVCGREKDVLFAAGRNIYPQDVEAAAATVPEVRGGGVAAFGIPRGTADRLVVAVEAAPAADVADVRHAVTEAVVDEVGLAPTAVLVLRPGRLPKTTSGKLRRSEVRARYLSGELEQSQERNAG
jgi:fatty-acyl-CoA synthase